MRNLSNTRKTKSSVAPQGGNDGSFFWPRSEKTHKICQGFWRNRTKSRLRLIYFNRGGDDRS